MKDVEKSSRLEKESKIPDSNWLVYQFTNSVTVMQFVRFDRDVVIFRVIGWLYWQFLDADLKAAQSARVIYLSSARQGCTTGLAKMDSTQNTQ